MTKRVAILDDYQGAGAAQSHWQKLGHRIMLDDFRDTLHAEHELVQRLRPYQIIVPIRERTFFSGSLLRQLSELELLSLTGKSSGMLTWARLWDQDFGDAENLPGRVGNRTREIDFAMSA